MEDPHDPKDYQQHIGKYVDLVDEILKDCFKTRTQVSKYYVVSLARLGRIVLQKINFQILLSPITKMPFWHRLSVLCKKPRSRVENYRMSKWQSI